MKKIMFFVAVMMSLSLHAENMGPTDLARIAIKPYLEAVKEIDNSKAVYLKSAKIDTEDLSMIVLTYQAKVELASNTDMSISLYRGMCSNSSNGVSHGIKYRFRYVNGKNIETRNILISDKICIQAQAMYNIYYDKY